jgi:electron transfer flavoprotein beta subunit
VQILVCVKRVPMVGGKIVIAPNGQELDTRRSGFTVSPHEECAVEEAVRLTERYGGEVTVLTLGPPEAVGRLRDMLALGASRAVLLETDGREWGPMATAGAIADAVRGHDRRYDLLLFGNESADTGGYQVPVRVAHALGLPCATGIKGLEITSGDDGGPSRPARARREYRGAEEVFNLPLPAVISVKEGINLPRYPSLPGRLRAKRAAIEQLAPHWQPEGLTKLGLRLPAGERRRAEILGRGTDTVPALLALLAELGC